MLRYLQKHYFQLNTKFARFVHDNPLLVRTEDNGYRLFIHRHYWYNAYEHVRHKTEWEFNEHTIRAYHEGSSPEHLIRCYQKGINPYVNLKNLECTRQGIQYRIEIGEKTLEQAEAIASLFYKMILQFEKLYENEYE